MKRSTARHRFDEPLLGIYLVLVTLGLILVYSTSSIMADSRFGSHSYFLRQQFIWVIISLAVMAVIYRIDLRRWATLSVPALFVTMVLLLAVFLMPSRNGAHRWLMLGPFTLQPSELFRFLTIWYLAFSLANPRRDLTDVRQLLLPYLPLLGSGLLLIMLQPNLGMVLLTVSTILGIFFLAGLRWKHLAIATLPVVGLASLVVFVIGYKRARVMDHLNALVDPLQGSYQVQQSALTLGSGGVLGAGFGEGRQKLFFLPYPHTDFIFSAAGEEIGLIGLLVVLGLLFAILWRGLLIARRQPDKFGFLLAGGVTWSLFVSIAVNVGVVTVLLPVTGVPLPFVSYGGSSLVVSSAAIAVLLNLSRRTAPAYE